MSSAPPRPRSRPSTNARRRPGGRAAGGRVRAAGSAGRLVPDPVPPGTPRRSAHGRRGPRGARGGLVVGPGLASAGQRAPTRRAGRRRQPRSAARARGDRPGQPAGATGPGLSAGPGHAGRGGPVRSPTGSAVRRPRRRRSAVRPDPGRRPRRGAPDRSGDLRARDPDHPGPAHPDDRSASPRGVGRGSSRGRTSGREPSGCTCTTSYGSCSKPSWHTAHRPSRSSCTERSGVTSWIGWPTRANRIPIGPPPRYCCCTARHHWRPRPRCSGTADS